MVFFLAPFDYIRRFPLLPLERDCQRRFSLLLAVFFSLPRFAFCFAGFI